MSFESFRSFLKNRYSTGKVVNVTEYKRLLYALIAKDPNCSGEIFYEPIIYSNPQGIGATRSIAQSNQALAMPGPNLVGKKWALTFGDYKGGIEIGEREIRASRDDEGAFMRAKGAELDGILEALADHYSALLYSDSGHALGSGTFNTGTAVVTLTNPDDIVNYAIGMTVQASANDGTSTGHSLLGTGSIGYIFSVDENAGTFTVASADAASPSAGAPAGWTTTAMYFFRQGDFGGGASPNTFFHGIGAWLTSSAPSAGVTWYGVDRSVSSKLQGVRLTSGDLAGAGTEQRAKRLITRMTGRVGGPGPSHVVLNNEKWQSLADSMEARGTRALNKGTAAGGYKSIELAASGADVEVIADRFCPNQLGLALALKHWKFRSYGPLIDTLKGDGNELLRKTTSDTYEVRFVSFPVFSTDAPSYSGRFAV